MEQVIEIRLKDGRIVDAKFKDVAETNDIVSPYAKFIDGSWIGWLGIPRGYELMHLKRIEHLANDKLISNRKLYLNDVYELLHLPKTKIGSYAGWRYEENNKVGDNFVDFGIIHIRNRDFINGCGRCVVLDFNVDGVI